MNHSNQNMMLVTQTNERIEKLAEDIKALPQEEIEKIERWVDSKGKQTFSIPEAAYFLGVCPDTIRKAVKEKTIKAVQITKNGVWRIAKSEIERFMSGEVK